MEYQAKELFAKHGVAGALGKTVETPEDARAAAEEIGGVVVVKAQVKAGGRGKAGGVKVAKTPEEAEEAARAILDLEIKGLPVNRVLVVPGASIEEEYYFSFLLDRSNRSYLCIASVEGGVEIEEVAKTNPDAVKKIPIDAGTGVDAAKAARDRRRGRLPGRAARPGDRDGPAAVDRLRRGGRHAGRGQPARPADRRQARGARRQGVARRQRRLPPRGPRAVRDPRGVRPARGEGQGQGPQLRQARRRRSGSSATARAWSCRPSTSSRTPARSTAA